MNNKIKAIQTALIEGTIETPEKLSRAQEILSAYYSQLADELAILQNKSNVDWIETRKHTKSDSQAEKELLVTEDGQKITLLKYKLKSLEKLIGAIKNRISVKNNELRNLY